MTEQQLAAMQQALEALELMVTPRGFQAQVFCKEAYDNLRTAIEQAETAQGQEPVDWEAVAADQAMTIAMMKAERKPWVGLTEKEKWEARNSVSYSPLAMTMREWTEAVQDATEAKLKEKNIK